MSTYHKFDEKKIQAIVATAANIAASLKAGSDAEANRSDDGQLALAAGRVSLNVKNEKACLKLPLGFGKVCIPIPNWIPDGQLATASLSVCTHFGTPTGVMVTISVDGHLVASETFLYC